MAPRSARGPRRDPAGPGIAGPCRTRPGGGAGGSVAGHPASTLYPVRGGDQEFRGGVGEGCEAAAGAAPVRGRHQRPGGGPADPQRPTTNPYTAPSRAAAASRQPDSDSLRVSEVPSPVEFNRPVRVAHLSPSLLIEILLVGFGHVNPPDVFTFRSYSPKHRPAVDVRSPVVTPAGPPSGPHPPARAAPGGPPGLGRSPPGGPGPRVARPACGPRAGRRGPRAGWARVQVVHHHRCAVVTGATAPGEASVVVARYGGRTPGRLREGRLSRIVFASRPWRLVGVGN